MFREFMLWMSETIFYIQGGVMLINTPWIFVWVFFWSLVMTLPMFYVFNVKPSTWAPIAFMVMFFPSLMMAIGPGIVQVQMMQECKTVENESTRVYLNGELVDIGPLNVRICRYKDNFYGDFGEWKTVGEKL